MPKYDFAFDGLTNDDFAMSGVERVSHFPDTFKSAEPLIHERLASDGFVLLAGDVFYLAHCPEYRNTHLFHLVIVTGYDADTGCWSIIDDNPASVLCHYSYPTSDLAAFYDNNSVRELRTYRSIDAPTYDAVITRFRATQMDHTDSLALFLDLKDILASPWHDIGTVGRHLGEAMSIFAGSRLCLGAFLRHVLDQPDVAIQADALSASALKLRDLITFSGIRNARLSERGLDRARDLAAAEKSFSTALFSFAQSLEKEMANVLCEH